MEDSPFTLDNEQKSGVQPPKEFAALFASKTHDRFNAIVPVDLGHEQPQSGPAPIQESVIELPQSEGPATFAQQFNSKSAFGETHNWSKVKKGESDGLGNMLKGFGSLFSGFSMKKLIPGALGLSVILGGFLVVRNISTPTESSSASGVSDTALAIIKDEVRDELILEQKDEVVTNSMNFLKQASVRFENLPSTDVTLLNSSNITDDTRANLENNMKLYTTIYLHKDMVNYHLDQLEAAGVENNDLKATMFSIFELEHRAYENVIEIESMLDELDSLYQVDRALKLEIRAIANEVIVQLNQTNAELVILIQRLDRFFVD